MDALVASTSGHDGDRLKRMAARLVHRGRWRDSDVAIDDQASLARIALSEDSAVGLGLPRRMAKDDQVTVVIAGYITRSELPVAGSDLIASLLADYLKVGVRAIGKLHGAYSILIADRREQALHLARDGAGVRTAFYGRIGNDWLVASEPKAISGEANFRKSIRPEAVAQYLAFSFVPGAGTMLENLLEVPCGHAVTLKSGEEPKQTNLFEFELEEPVEHSDAISDQDWIDRTRDVVSRAVAERLPKGEPVGIFLSGGLDSSIVAAEVARQHDHPVLSYAIHFGDGYPNELEYARAVADRCGTQHHEVLIQPKEFSKRMRQMVWHLDDPIGDPITQPNYELARRVSQDVRWVFNGEGGDPVFGGPKNIPMMLQHWYGVKRDPAFRERAYLASYRRAYDECTRVLNESFRREIDWGRDLESVLTPFFDQTPLRSFLNKLMAINIRLKGAHLILPKVERMLAASELTPLSPLFDESLIRLSFQMPPTMKLQRGVEKWALKRAYEDALPREVIDRPKSGMRVPVHYWFRGEMRRMAKKVLSPRRLKRSEIFDHRRVKQLLRYDTEEGPRRYGMRLWMLMTFELWRESVMGEQ